MERTGATRRKNDYAKAIRKQKIAASYYNGWNDVIGKYIKGKIHCSCPLCSAKTRSRKRYGTVLSYTHSDSKKIDSMKEQYRMYITMKGDIDETV